MDARTARRRQDPIGRKLRQMYDEVVEEHIPDEFMMLLEDADDLPNGIINGNGTDHDEPASQRPVKTES